MHGFVCGHESTGHIAVRSDVQSHSIKKGANSHFYFHSSEHVHHECTIWALQQHYAHLKQLKQHYPYLSQHYKHLTAWLSTSIIIFYWIEHDDCEAPWGIRYCIVVQFTPWYQKKKPPLWTFFFLTVDLRWWPRHFESHRLSVYVQNLSSMFIILALNLDNQHKYE